MISNLKVIKYKKGEYIQREGQEPEGLTIIREGYAICAAEKLSHRFIGKCEKKSMKFGLNN